MIRRVGFFLVAMAFYASSAHAQIPIPAEKPIKPKAALIRPDFKPLGYEDFTMVNDKYVFSADNLKKDGIITPPALPSAKDKDETVAVPLIKPLVIRAAKTERITSSKSFEDSVLVRYTNNDNVDDRMAGSRGKELEIQRLPAQQNIRIRETNDKSPFETASLPKASRMHEQEPVIIFFKELSSDLEVGQIEIINSDIINNLKRNRSRKASVYGYAEGERGKQTANELSQSRALLISDYLVDRGIEPSRIEARGMGTDTAISPKNRVDVVIFN